MATLPYAHRGGRPRGLTKDVWGPKAWAWLHAQAIHYPANPAKGDRLAMFARFWSFIHTLPCPECRAHAVAYARRYPPDFSGSEAFQTWAWCFHNSVNHRLGKPLMTAEEYRREYRSEIAESYWRLV